MEPNLKSEKGGQSKVSILVPVYKVEQFIERCAQSLFSQTYPNIDFIFVNDCTPDNSMSVLTKVINQYQEKNIIIIEHDRNQGIGATRNTLLKAATGDYLLWVDSDDFITENAVEILVSAIEESCSDIVTSDSYIFHKGENNFVTFSQQFKENPKQYIDAIANHQARAALWGTLSKRSVWVENKIIIPDTSTFGEDYFATVQLFYFSKKIQVIHYPFYYYNQVNVNSYTAGYKTESHFVSTINLFENLMVFFENQNAEFDYTRFINRARITEFSGLLLHTKSNLRRKYSFTIKIEDLSKYYNEVSITRWQYFLLKQIVLKRYYLSDILIFKAKVIRKIFKINF